MTSLLGVIESLAADPLVKDDYASDPSNFLERHGFDDLTPEDVAEALAHAANSFPPVLAEILDPIEGLQSVAGVVLDHLGLSGVDDFSVVPAELEALLADLPEPGLADQDDGDDSLAMFGQDPAALDAQDRTAPDAQDPTTPDAQDPAEGSASDTDSAESTDYDLDDVHYEFATEPIAALGDTTPTEDPFDLLSDPDAGMFAPDADGSDWVEPEPSHQLDETVDPGLEAHDFDDLDS